MSSQSVHLLTFFFLGRLLSGWPMLCALTFASNWQLPPSAAEEENNRSNYFMIDLHISYVVELGFELATPGSAVRRTTNYSMARFVIIQPVVTIGFVVAKPSASKKTREWNCCNQTQTMPVIICSATNIFKTYNKTCVTSKDWGQPVQPLSMARVSAVLSWDRLKAVEG